MARWWAATNISPKKQFQAVLNFGSALAAERKYDLKYYVRRFSKPGIEQINYQTESVVNALSGRADIVHHSSTGRTLKPIDIEIVDVNSTQNASACFYDILSYLGYTGGSESALEQFKDNSVGAWAAAPLMNIWGGKLLHGSKNPAAPGQWNIFELNDAGNTIAQWVIQEPKLNKVDFGEFDYNGDSLATMKMQIYYTNFKYEGLG